jgi:hypothetical protein
MLLQSTASGLPENALLRYMQAPPNDDLIAVRHRELGLIGQMSEEMRALMGVFLEI